MVRFTAILVTGNEPNRPVRCDEWRMEQDLVHRANPLVLATAAGAAVMAIVVATVVLIVNLTDDNSSATGDAKTTTSDLPPCAEIWIVGVKLPEDYAGCIERDGVPVEPESISCGVDPSWGEEVIHWFDDGTRRYLAWSASEHDYRVEWKIEDGDRIGSAIHKSVWDTSLKICKSP